MKRARVHDHPLYQGPCNTAEDLAAPAPEDDLPEVEVSTLDPGCQVSRICPGVVVIRRALTAEAQVRAARALMARGREPPPRGFWRETTLGPGNSQRREPNSSPNAGRGRVYDAVRHFPAFFTRLCADVVRVARVCDGALPSMHATHVLAVHYSHGNGVQPKIFWHKDDAPNDGLTDKPVVSFSLGEACDFLLCHAWSLRTHRQLDLDGAIHRLRLESGDAVVFGGPARYIHHCVQRVHLHTCPAHLAPVLGQARLNLTFRDAPGVDEAAYTRFTPTEQARAARGKADQRRSGTAPAANGCADRGERDASRAAATTQPRCGGDDRSASAESSLRDAGNSPWEVAADQAPPCSRRRRLLYE
mmetsp:Transcript_25122/g.68119  ORF Transcript_25122/g.68119 Transcript_25122/m.68119 type:complete len:360 (-) Transcript_25122:230-1309(-)